jgi:Ribonuclease G/E
MDQEMVLVSKYPEAYIFYNESPLMDKYKIDMVNSLNANKPDIIVLNKEGTFRVKKDLFQTFPDLAEFLKEYKLEKEIKEINNVTYSIYSLDREKKN